jgi:hypothetical protein
VALEVDLHNTQRGALLWRLLCWFRNGLPFFFLSFSLSMGGSFGMGLNAA